MTSGMLVDQLPRQMPVAQPVVDHRIWRRSSGATECRGAVVDHACGGAAGRVQRCSHHRVREEYLDVPEASAGSGRAEAESSTTWPCRPGLSPVDPRSQAGAACAVAGYGSFVDCRAAGAVLLEDFHLWEKITRCGHERIRNWWYMPVAPRNGTIVALPVSLAARGRPRAAVQAFGHAVLPAVQPSRTQGRMRSASFVIPRR